MRSHLLVRVLACALVITFGMPVTAIADGGVAHQTLQARPIQLGTSGGNVFDRSMIYCCSGTLGALVVDNNTGQQLILSNNHVLARFNQGIQGEPVNQPGQIDQSCGTDGQVAELTAFVPIQTTKGRKIKWNTVDAAVAAVIPGDVAADGSILDIGPVSDNTIAAFVGQSVQKSGRTTGHTNGTVLNIDVTTSVGYSNECGGAPNQTAYFQNQIRIGNGDFSDGGDSGSLIVEAGSTDPANGLPRAVGLLFAGDSSSTVANPINAVLAALNVSMVGGAIVPPGPTGTIAGVVTDADTGSGISGAAVSAGSRSTTADAAGAYVLDGVPTGTYTVEADASGYAAASQSGVTVNENQTAVADFQLTPSAAPAEAIPGCVIYDQSGGRFGDKNLLVSIKVVDDFGNPVSGAAVDISVDRDGSLFGSGSGATTNSSGIVTYNARNADNGTYVTTVTNISAGGLAFSGAGTTPNNAFAKGTDPAPASFCAAGVSPSSGAAAKSGATLNKARAANARNSARLMALSGVAGHGVGLGANGNPVIDVFVLSGSPASAAAGIPKNLDGVDVRVIHTDGFVAR